MQLQHIQVCSSLQLKTQPSFSPVGISLSMTTPIESINSILNVKYHLLFILITLAFDLHLMLNPCKIISLQCMQSVVLAVYVVLSPCSACCPQSLQCMQSLGLAVHLVDSVHVVLAVHVVLVMDAVHVSSLLVYTVISIEHLDCLMGKVCQGKVHFGNQHICKRSGAWNFNVSDQGLML